MLWVSVDANAAIDYARESALHKLGMDPTGRRAAALRMRLDRMPHVFISETASIEAGRNLEKDIRRKVGYSKGVSVYAYASRLLHAYCLTRERTDHLGRVSAARKIYEEINADPSDPRLADWKRRKGEFVYDPVLGSDIHDLNILSTSAHYVQFYEVELWTHDMDFTMFADEIYKTFGLKVVDTYRLGGRSCSRRPSR